MFLRPFARRLLFGLVVLVVTLFPVGPNLRARARQQQRKLTSLQLGRAEDMLASVYAGVKKNYYDPKYHGLDVDARYKEFLERLKHAPTLGEAFRTIAAFLSGLNDSHTFFIPPRRGYRFDYGYRMQMVGDRCMITGVRPGSDAEKKLHPGDQVVSLGKFAVNRGDLWQLEYYLNSLAPMPATDFSLRDPAGNLRSEQVVTKYINVGHMKDMTIEGGLSGYWQLIMEEEQEEHLLRNRYVEAGDLMIWQLPMFIDDENAMADMFAKARKHKALILDLRGNPGGDVTALEFMLGSVFDHDVKIATQVMRKDQKDLIAKSRKGNAFTGQLIVLVDSRSASASELFARVVQLEHRGTVVGDLSSGSVMESQVFPYQIGMEDLGGFDLDAMARSQGGVNLPQDQQGGYGTIVFYAASITRADLIMQDGKSLEKVGVTPDVMALPTAADLAAGRDPVLAKAAELAGAKLDPAAAGKMFPFEWAPQ